MCSDAKTVPVGTWLYKLVVSEIELVTLGLSIDNVSREPPKLLGLTGLRVAYPQHRTLYDSPQIGDHYSALSPLDECSHTFIPTSKLSQSADSVIMTTDGTESAMSRLAQRS